MAAFPSKDWFDAGARGVQLPTSRFKVAAAARATR